MGAPYFSLDDRSTVAIPRSFIESLHLLLWGEVRTSAPWREVLDEVARLKRASKVEPLKDHGGQ